MATISLEGLTLKVKAEYQDNNAFLNEKLKIIYKKLDFDGKGYVEQKDFVTWAERAAKIAGVELTDKIRKTWMDAYNVYFGRSSNFEEWKLYHEHKTMKIQGLTEKQLKINLPLLQTVDAIGKGFISWDQYKAFVMPLGATESEAHIGFGSIDTNGDGVISYEEFSQAYTMYHTDRSDSKYKHFWGEFQSDDSFLIEKLKRFYDKFDFQGTGCVTKKDCATWMEATTKMIGTKVTSEVKKAWSAWFDAYFGQTKSFEEWKGHWLAIARNTKDLREYAELTMTGPIFKTMDTDGDGIISWNEYKAFVMPLGAKEADAHMGFWAIDISGDGTLSMKEFSNACTKYFTDRTDSRFKHFFGEYKPDDSFLVEKLRRFYQKIDFENNGVVEKKNYAKWGEELARISGIPLTDELKNLWVVGFDAYYGDTRNFKEWKDRVVSSISAASQLIPPYEDHANPIFDAVDTDKDGHITWDEYKAFILPLGVTEAEAHVAFGKVDTNGDGMLSYEEFSYAGVMYYMDKHDSRYKHFYGEWKENGSK